MSREMEYLLRLCADYLEGTPAVLEEEIRYEGLYQVAKVHNLSAVVFSVMNTGTNKSIVPKEIFKRFEDDFWEAVIRYDIQGKVLSELDELLSAQQIDHVFFKGAEIKELYPVPQVRVMGDIDILLRQKDRDRAKKLLTQNGFVLKNANGPVYDYTKDNVLIEAHTKIVSGKVGNSNAEQGFADAADHAQYTNYRGTPDADYHFAYLLTHIAHHFWFYGAGIKLILDLAVIQKQQEIHYDAVLRKMDEVGLREFSETILTVCHKWFGVGQGFDRDTEKTEAFLTSFGAFGNVRRNKAAIIERKELEEGKKTSALMTRLRLLFPPYRKLKNIPYIKFIDGRPYLLPYAWIYRIIYNFKHRKQLVKSSTMSIGSDESKSEAENELAYFKEIGLL